MKKTTLLSLTAVAILAAAPAATRAGEDSMADRYDAYVAKTEKESTTTKLTTSLFGKLNKLTLVKTVRAAARYSFRITTGKINPTNTAAFSSDFEFAARQQLDDQLEAHTAHQYATGAGVVVAVLDGGFDLNHPEIAGSLLPWSFDAVNKDFDAHDLGNGIDDDNDGLADRGVGHGTFVAGMVLRAAPGAQILPVRIADDEGYGTEAELVEGLQFAMDMGVQVINLSFEGGLLGLETQNKLSEAEDRGIVVVVSAGNGGEDYMESVAAKATTLAVAAVDSTERLADFSNKAGWSQNLDVAAPGVDLVGPHGGFGEGSSAVWSGTSFSAPLVAGAVALTLEQDPGRMPSQVRALIRNSVDTAVDRDGDVLTQAGRLNLRKVVGQ